MFNDIKGVIICKGFDIPADLKKFKVCLGNQYWVYDCDIHKFPLDEVFEMDEERLVCFGGYVTNKKSILENLKGKTWKDVVCNLVNTCMYTDFRGSFYGILTCNAGTRLFVDHMGNRTLYYYSDSTRMIASTSFFMIVEVLKTNKISIPVDEQAVKYMLTQGFMSDDTTFCSDIKRVCPGCAIDIDASGSVTVTKYYSLDNTKVNRKMSENEAIDGIDRYFRQAVKREFDKDLECGYDHLVDLSGGLDSRSVCWVAHEMGYTNQINTNYSQSGSLDFIISQKIALHLGHRYVYMPLDDFGWILDIDLNTKLLEGSNNYGGCTGARRLLDAISGINCGIEHTGIFGDAVLGSHVAGEDKNYGSTTGYEESDSKMLKYDIPSDLLCKYGNRELYWLNVRGLLGMQGSCILRQNYFATGAPFLDVDFVNYMMTVPHKYRDNHYIYIRWLEERYYECTKFGWTSWHGARPRIRSKLLEKKMFTVKMKIRKKLDELFVGYDSQGMNPVDYWMDRNSAVREKIEAYYSDKKEVLDGIISGQLRNDLDLMFYKGNTSEKMQALTVCSTIAQML